MTTKDSTEVWTEWDRLCDKCHARLASADDWLCQQCREAFEAQWLQLTTQGRPRPAPMERADAVPA